MEPLIWVTGCSFVASLIAGRECWQSGSRKIGGAFFVVALIIALSVPTMIGVKVWEVVKSVLNVFFWVVLTTIPG